MRFLNQIGDILTSCLAILVKIYNLMPTTIEYTKRVQEFISKLENKGKL
jgi:hypothetical protein